MKKPAVTLAALLGIVLVTMPTTASACAVCMGDPNSNTASAMNAAIFVMLGFLFSMLGALIAFGVYLYRRSQSQIPEHLQLAEMIGTSTK